MEIMADEGSKQNLNRSVGTPEARAQKGIFNPAFNRWLLGLCVIQFALLIAITLKEWGPSHSSEQQPGTAGHASAKTAFSGQNREPFFQGHPGPWGHLEYARINIEPPDEFISPDGQVPEKERWFFAGYTRTKLLALFNTSGLTPPQRSELLNNAPWQEDTNGIFVTPGDKLILDMSPEARTQIYSVLAESPQNDFQFWPCVFRNGGINDWFQDSGLSDTTLALVKRLVYRRGSALCFSDVPEVTSRISSVVERRRLEKTLSRNSTILMKLRVGPSTDVQALMAYWVKDGRHKDIEPLLTSLTMVPGGMTIDVVHLLPPFARKHLNTYPDPSPSDHAPDCYWSAMNFFNDPPDDRYYDDAAWRAELQRDYSVVTNATYGDLVFLLRPDSSPIHAAVYIADDVVFTKNGANYRQPWMLVKMEDLMARYIQPFPVQVAIFHSNKRGG
jgi:hypothetical protein